MYPVAKGSATRQPVPNPTLRPLPPCRDVTPWNTHGGFTGPNQLLVIRLCRPYLYVKRFSLSSGNFIPSPDVYPQERRPLEYSLHICSHKVQILLEPRRNVTPQVLGHNLYQVHIYTPCQGKTRANQAIKEYTARVVRQPRRACASQIQLSLAPITQSGPLTQQTPSVHQHHSIMI